MKLFGRSINFKSIQILLIFLAGTAAIIALFPRGGKFRYEFQKGKPWMHEVLVAPFDFPIYKPDAVIQAEKDSVLKDFEPYFQYDSSVLIREESRLEVLISSAWVDYLKEAESKGMLRSNQVVRQHSPDSLEALYRRSMDEILERLYKRGIVQDPVQLENVHNRESSVNVIMGQVVNERQVSTLFTQKSAYEFLKSEFTGIGGIYQPNVKPEDRFIAQIDPGDLIEPDLFYDEETSNRVKESLVNEISLTQGMVQAGEKIIALGEPVNDQKYQILQSLKREYETNPGVARNYNLIFAGQILLVAFAFLVLYLFLFHFRKEILNSGLKTFFIIMLVVLMASLATLTIRTQSLSLYVVPFVILPVIMKTFYDARIALFVHLITILLIGFWAPNGFEFIFMNFIAGVVTIFTLRNLYRRGILFVSAVFALISYSLVYTGMGLIQEGSIENLEWKNYAWFAGNALMVLTSYPLIYIFEKLFGFISDATLVELSDTNQSLLRQLAEKAPGTFQHSLQVANLAEEAIINVEGNPLLIRAGALYHDIGKMEDPMYFVENLTSNFNPHDNLEFEVSAEKIIGHVSKGVEIAKKHKLPGVIIDFIKTHHGTTTVQYFYKSYLKKYPEADVDIARFTYPGPKPFSKETAVLMMADSTEAASRSLKSINKEVINNLVENIIDNQIKEQQFQNVDLTFRDFSTIKEIFKRKLINIYHARIEYPE
ncbi:MAG TPA: HDIG domain-containing protein [Bacteroidales bacterium]|nr:HDIG domain-containing protein [Bacteroidales bacterium]